jgi:hypothetical protein
VQEWGERLVLCLGRGGLPLTAQRELALETFERRRSRLLTLENGLDAELHKVSRGTTPARGGGGLRPPSRPTFPLGPGWQVQHLVWSCQSLFGAVCPHGLEVELVRAWMQQQTDSSCDPTFLDAVVKAAAAASDRFRVQTRATGQYIQVGEGKNRTIR